MRKEVSIGYERRLEDSPRSLGRGDRRTAVRFDIRWRREDGRYGLDDEGLHDGRWSPRHTVRVAVLGGACSPSHCAASLDRYPTPAASLPPGNCLPARH